jgi:hypothetical protein
MKNHNYLINLYKISSNITLAVILYDEYLDESLYIKLITCLFHFNYMKKEIILPFSLNLKSEDIIFYNIYRKFNFKKLDKLLETLEKNDCSNVKYLFLDTHINKNLKLVELPKNFNDLAKSNIKLLDTYLKKSKYKVCNYQENGII